MLSKIHSPSERACRMVLFFPGKSNCVLCGEVISTTDEVIGTPPFLVPGQEFYQFSDAAFHKSCFEGWKDRERFQTLFDAHRKIWETRPGNVAHDSPEAQAWFQATFPNDRTPDQKT